MSPSLYHWAISAPGIMRSLICWGWKTPQMTHCKDITCLLTEPRCSTLNDPLQGHHMPVGWATMFNAEWPTLNKNLLLWVSTKQTEALFLLQKTKSTLCPFASPGFIRTLQPTPTWVTCDGGYMQVSLVLLFLINPKTCFRLLSLQAYVYTCCYYF